MTKKDIPGTLFIVSTPIGNTGDITIRAVDVLKQVEYCLCEDTRKTKNLLVKIGVNPPKLISYYQENEDEKIHQVIDRLKNGDLVALVSNAGMPLISDPGYRLVRAVIEEGIGLTVIPGPSAVTAALTLSGLPPDKFIFLGFLPKKRGKRKKLLKKALEIDADLSSSVIFYESPFRVINAIEDIKDLNNKLSVSVCREMTKKFETVVRGNPERVLLELKKGKIKGEITVVVSKKI